MPEVYETGTIVRWGAHGFGFVRPDSGGGEIFVHVSDIDVGQRVSVGDRVSFRTLSRRNGRPCAANVQVISDAA